MYKRQANQLAHAPNGHELTINGRAPRAGELFRNEALAMSLQSIAETRGESFYRGDLAKKIVAFAQKNGGALDEAEGAARLRALSAARHVHIGWLQDGGHARRVLARDGVSLSQDEAVNAAPEDLDVEGLTIAFASLSEAQADHAEKRAAELVAKGANGAVITLGARGSLALIGGQVGQRGPLGRRHPVERGLSTSQEFDSPTVRVTLMFWLSRS